MTDALPLRRHLIEHAQGVRKLGGAILAGALCACAFAPIRWHALIWIGLVPLILVITRNPRCASRWGAVAGFVFFLITLHPLVSAYSWIGWAQESEMDFQARMLRQWWLTHALWVLFALWGAIFWGAWASLTMRLSGSRPWRLALVAPSLWILIPEWLRATSTFDVTWSVFGYATVELLAIRQLAALGGLYLLSALIVLINVAIAHLISQRGRRRWTLLIAAAGVWFAVWSWGTASAHRPLTGSTPIAAAVLQHHQADYTTKDFTEWGFDRHYLPLIRDALQRRAQVLVIPETVIVGAVSLDGSASQTKTPDFQFPLDVWDAKIRSWLAGTDTILLISLDTIEREADHSTVVAWTQRGIAGTYHKRHLVPFSEYSPWGLRRWLLHGRSQYSPGIGSQIIHVHDLTFGGFICQEVMLPQLTRHSVLDGASLLVTGGNDGVFVDPAVARVNAQMAQLRAVETGRYMLRAMKTGISAIIDPHGAEVARSRFDEPVTLFATISPQRTLTPYVKYGDWILWLAALIVAFLVAFPHTPFSPKRPAHLRRTSTR